MSDNGPMTIRELIIKLQGYDPDALVMIKCPDDYYSGEIADVEFGQAVLVLPHVGKTPAEDAYGRPEPQRDIQFPGGWSVLGRDEDRRTDVPVGETRDCFIIHTTG
jgi:hypothetical protein